MTTILIVDDEENMRQLIDMILVRAGFQTLQAENGTKAYHMLTQQRIDLVLLDIMMPGEDGFIVCEAIQAITKIPVIFLTALDASAELSNNHFHNNYSQSGTLASFLFSSQLFQYQKEAHLLSELCSQCYNPVFPLLLW